VVQQLFGRRLDLIGSYAELRRALHRSLALQPEAILQMNGFQHSVAGAARCFQLGATAARRLARGLVVDGAHGDLPPRRHPAHLLQLMSIRNIGPGVFECTAGARLRDLHDRRGVGFIVSNWFRADWGIPGAANSPIGASGSIYRTAGGAHRLRPQARRARHDHPALAVDDRDVPDGLLSRAASITGRMPVASRRLGDRPGRWASASAARAVRSSGWRCALLALTAVGFVLSFVK
jgi:hypothetical protein